MVLPALAAPWVGVGQRISVPLRGFIGLWLKVATGSRAQLYQPICLA